MDGKVCQVYRYGQDFKTGRRRLLATSEIAHGVFGLNLYDSKCRRVYFCESVWDAMAWWETLSRLKRSGQELKVTGSQEASILADSCVLASPGCNVFREEWASLFAGKEVHLLCQSDHPSPASGKSASLEGMKRVARILAHAPETPESIRYLKWGDKGYAPELPSGYDIRDRLGSIDLAGRAPLVKELLDRIQVIPSDWIPGRTLVAKKRGGTEIEVLACSQWKDLENSWRKAMTWTPGLGRALPAMLACIPAIRMPDAQLWMKIISPPSTGKTSLAEALGVNKKYVKEVSNFRGFHSGFMTDARGTEDHSLIAMLRDMLLIIKDADTLLKAPNRDQILAEMRDAYDTNSTATYRTSVKRDYKGYRFGVIMCGTESLLELDAAELGARFLDCVIMDGIDDELETDVNRRKFFSVFRNRGVEANGDLETHREADLLRAMQLTAGYVTHLKENGSELLRNIDDSNAEDLVGEFDAMSKFVAFLRSRPPKKQDEITAREMSVRLNVQLTKLALCEAVVLGHNQVDKEIMERVRKIALDTARGRIYNLVRRLVGVGREGATVYALSRWLNETEDKVRKELRHLYRIKAVEHYDKIEGGQKKRMARLTRTLEAICKKVMDPVT
jgi:hypothetical protein